MSKSNKIVYTEESEQDLLNAYSYLAMDFLMPETEKNQVNRMMKAINDLDTLPFPYKLYQDEPWHSKGLRVLPVDNYLVFYTIIEDENTVVVISAKHGGSEPPPRSIRATGALSESHPTRSYRAT